MYTRCSGDKCVFLTIRLVLPLTRAQNDQYQRGRSRGLKRDDLYTIDSYLTQEETLSTGRFTSVDVFMIQDIQTHYIR